MIRHELIKATEAFLKDKFDHATDFEQHDMESAEKNLEVTKCS